MKDLRKLLTALLLCMCCVMGAGSAASAAIAERGTMLSAEGNVISYEVDNDNIGIVTLTIKGKGAIADTGNGDCNPNEIPWLKGIGRNAHIVHIEEGITSIGGYAFQDMINLGEVFLPEGLVEIKEHAFDRCNYIAEVHLPSSVTRIGEWVFDYKVLFYCERDSYACRWAEEHGLICQYTDCAHTETAWKVLRKPKCATGMEGEKGLVCLNPACSAVLKRESIPRSPHTWGEWVKTSDATYNRKEEQKRTCSVCREVEFRYVGEPLVKVNEIKVSGTSMILTGKKQTLKAKVYPSNASDKTVRWSLSEASKKYASITSKGVVTAKAAGAGKTIRVYAAAGGKKQSFTIRLKGAVKKITLKAAKTVKVGKKTTVRATVSVGKGGSKALTWSSSNKRYATVSSKGVVKALKAGKGKSVVITAKAKDGSGKKASIRIRIR